MLLKIPLSTKQLVKNYPAKSVLLQIILPKLNWLTLFCHSGFCYKSSTKIIFQEIVKHKKCACSWTNFMVLSLFVLLGTGS